MKLTKVRVRKFRSIDDSTDVEAADVLAMVGKNESGKTTFLRALANLNHVEESQGNFDVTRDYPRREANAYKKIHDQNPAVPISATFALDKNEVAAIEAAFAPGVLNSVNVVASKNYKNERQWKVDYNEVKVIAHRMGQASLAVHVIDALKGAATFEELIDLLEKMPERMSTTEEFLTAIKRDFAKGLCPRIISEFLVKWLPRFVYFDDYFIMNGKINMQAFLERQKNQRLDDADRTFLNLLAAADTTPGDFLNDKQDYETLKSKLEGVSASISDQVFEYWTQNRQLQVEFDVMTGNASEEAPFNQGTNLHIRIRNDRHRVSVSFDDRSRGFVWFFSFLAYFSKLNGAAPGSLILLLDEPGLSLHAKAQADLLRFFDEQLAPKYQVIYTTHSQHMVVPGRFERIRTVQDIDHVGTVVSKDILKNDADTVFPLLGAMGVELSQNLSIKHNNLLVEGPSDLIYLEILTRHARANGGHGLSPLWARVPAAGADKIAAYVALFGANRLNTVILMDVAPKDNQRIENLQERALLGRSSLVKITEFTGGKEADIEDLFDPEFYLELVNGAYADKFKTPLKLADLPNGNRRIVKRLEEHFLKNSIDGGEFSHYLPAEHFLYEQASLLPKMGKATLEKANQLFERVNKLIEAPGSRPNSENRPRAGRRPRPSAGMDTSAPPPA